MSIPVQQVGTYYIQTQSEIDNIKKQLQKLKPNIQKSVVLQNQYNQLYAQLQTLQTTLGNLNSDFYNQVINNFDVTAQKLPNVFESKEINSFILESTIIKSTSTIQLKLKLPNIESQQQKGTTYINQDALYKTSSKQKTLQKTQSVQQSNQSIIILVRGTLLQRKSQKQEIQETPHQLKSYGEQTKNSIQTVEVSENIERTFSSKEVEQAIQMPSKQSNRNEIFLQIIDGKLVKDDHKFIQFQNQSYEIWNKVEPILQSLCKVAEESKLKNCTVIGSRVSQLAYSLDKTKVFSLIKLVECFDNWEELAIQLEIPQLKFKIQNGNHLAATLIQSVWRGKMARVQFRKLRILISKVIIIQKSFRVFDFRRKVNGQIRKNNEYTLDRFKVRQTVFKDEWAFIKFQKRYEIHYNSQSFEEIKRLSMEKYSQRQNTQITRIFNLQDPQVNIIYISPYDLPSELIDYFYKILSLGDIPDCRNRLHFIWPDNHHIFPSHMSITQQMLYSPKAIKRIKQLIQNSPGYMVPGIITNDDIKLSDMLNLPLFSGLPQMHVYYSTKSGSKALFDELQLPQPVGIRNIYDEKELINSLSFLIVKNTQINTWILKIDDETQARGIAYIEVRKMLKHLEEITITNVHQLISKKIKKRLHFAYPQLFNSYQEYILMFTSRGGIIEACPLSTFAGIQSVSFNFKIDPDGELSLKGSYEKIKINEIQPATCISPQMALKLNNQYFCGQIAQKLYAKGLYGYFTIDCITHKAEQNQTQTFYTIGLDCYLNPYASSLQYFNFLMRGQTDYSSGEYIVTDQQKNLSVRHMVYCPIIVNEGLNVLQYKTFFQLCRLESISFNLEKKLGTTFILIDSLQSGIVSLLTVGSNVAQVIKYMTDALSFLMKNIGRGNDQINIGVRSDKINMMAIHQKLMGIIKRLEHTDYKSYNSQYL